jgi:hypothetical protein
MTKTIDDFLVKVLISFTLCHATPNLHYIPIENTNAEHTRKHLAAIN